jgi:hypothetical protein
MIAGSSEMSEHEHGQHVEGNVLVPTSFVPEENGMQLFENSNWAQGKLFLLLVPPTLNLWKL